MCNSTCANNPCGCSLFPCSTPATTSNKNLLKGFLQCQDKSNPLVDLDAYKAIQKNCYCPYMTVDTLCRIIPNSGVKIGYGIDLSTQTEQGLSDLGVSQTIIDKLKIFIGKANFPVYSMQFYTQSLTTAEVDALNNAVLQPLINSLAQHYDNNLYKSQNIDIPTDRPSFSQLTRGIRTSIFSVIQQYGQETAAQTFWDLALQAKFGDIIQLLKEDQQKYPERREKEIGIIQNCLNQCSQSQPSDVIFLMDGSGSLGNTAFQQGIQFIRNVTQGLTFGQYAQQAAVVVFSSQNRLIQGFTYDSSQMTSSLSSVSFPSGVTYTYDALEYCFNLFQQQSQTRKSSSQVIFILTDGYPSDSFNQTLLDNYKQKDIQMYAVGIGNGINAASLELMIGGAQYKQNIYQISDMTAISLLLNNFEQTVCNSPAPVFNNQPTQAVLSEGNTYFQINKPQILIKLDVDTSIQTSLTAQHGPDLMAFSTLNNIRQIQLYYSFDNPNPGQFNNDGQGFLQGTTINAIIDNKSGSQIYFSLQSQSSSQIGVKFTPSQLQTNCNDNCYLCLANQQCIQQTEFPDQRDEDGNIIYSTDDEGLSPGIIALIIIFVLIFILLLYYVFYFKKLPFTKLSKIQQQDENNQLMDLENDNENKMDLQNDNLVKQAETVNEVKQAETVNEVKQSENVKAQSINMDQVFIKNPSTARLNDQIEQTNQNVESQQQEI